ncbi:Peptidase S53 domain-containing protein [Mycena chlorophos]|uniref:Peptidase S53 domain-containing protein n=1 Tax=Mycena chlorophos TaxID=658473 RepID=A0A8H6VY02_MYCCL|nr:Peptidase S53 domain-containing protein [Mycena chlorophos]
MARVLVLLFSLLQVVAFVNAAPGPPGGPAPGHDGPAPGGPAPGKPAPGGPAPGGPAPAACKNPAVRKEWRSLTNTEQKDWIDALKCLAKLPHNPALAPTVPLADSQIPPFTTNSSAYDDWVYVGHSLDTFKIYEPLLFRYTWVSRLSTSKYRLLTTSEPDLNIRIRFTGLFFPWHRWLVQAFENDLKEKCGYQGTSPYWNWTIDSADVYNSPLFGDFNSETGLGGWGDPSNDYTVYNGAFSNTSGFNLAYPTPHNLRRNFTLQPFLTSGYFLPDVAQQQLYVNETFTNEQVQKMIHGFVGDYKGLQTYIEGFNGTHQGVHLMLGGDLGGTCPANAAALVPAECQEKNPTYSPNGDCLLALRILDSNTNLVPFPEPLFWMHHAMVDKIWSEWQAANPANGESYFGGSVEALKNLTYFTEFPTGAAPFFQINDTMPADGLYPDPTIASVLSTTAGSLCYVYE